MCVNTSIEHTCLCLCGSFENLEKLTIIEQKTENPQLNIAKLGLCDFVWVARAQPWDMSMGSRAAVHILRPSTLPLVRFGNMRARVIFANVHVLINVHAQLPGSTVTPARVYLARAGPPIPPPEEHSPHTRRTAHHIQAASRSGNFN